MVWKPDFELLNAVQVRVITTLQDLAKGSVNPDELYETMILTKTALDRFSYFLNDAFNAAYEGRGEWAALTPQDIEYATLNGKIGISHKGDSPVNPYPHSIILQFNNSGDNAGLGAIREYTWLTELQTALGDLLFGELEGESLGFMNESHSVAGVMELEATVTDLPTALKTITDYLIDHELMSFCKVASREGSQGEWIVQHPQGADFTPLEDMGLTHE